MTQDYVETLEALRAPHVHIKNREKVNKLIRDIVSGGFEKLQIVSDFDRTITKQHQDGEVHISSFGMFNKCPSLPKNVKQLHDELHNKYFPIELDHSIPHEAKKKLMVEWWTLTLESLKGVHITPEEIYETCKKLKPDFREGAKELFAWLYQKKVPILVFSAGLGDTVASVLKEQEVYLPNVKVVSNFLEFDENGYITGHSTPMIHVFNKNEYALKGTDYYNDILERENIIVLGDSVGDAGMADGILHSNAVLKIGFIYGNVQENLASYLEAFDIVLEDDQTMHVAQAILKLLK